MGLKIKFQRKNFKIGRDIMQLNIINEGQEMSSKIYAGNKLISGLTDPALTS